ncbi:MAG TPA: phosphoribosyl-ATP diphosphatase [Candidatus Obscuribacterales bacterium]
MLVPSIDIMDGKVVQLRQGQELVLTIDRDPVELARELNRYGEICVIDLDAAMGKGNNFALVKQILKAADCRVGGGIRDVETATALLKAGARRLIFGTAASPELMGKFAPQFCMVALDNRNGEVVDRGWQNRTGESVIDRANRLSDYCNSFLLTFVETEGSMHGMDVETAADLARSLPKPLTVAGGVRSTEEVTELARRGIDAQVGMALYTGAIDPATAFAESVSCNADGLIPTIVQDERGNVLMLAYSSKDSLIFALSRGVGAYFSRSRLELWEKGLTSGATQELISCRTDCDRDAVIFTVRQKKKACHTGAYSCFDQSSPTKPFTIDGLFDTLKARKSCLPENSYSAKLFRDRSLLESKLREELEEVISFSSKDNLRWEIADLIFFLSALAVDEGIEWKDIELELKARAK